VQVGSNIRFWVLANGDPNSGSGTEVMRVKSTGVIKISNVPTSNTGLSAGDLYMATAADILSNGDLVMGVKQ